MKDGPFAYGTSYVTGGEHPALFPDPREGAAGDETIRKVLLDGDREAEGKAFSVSPGSTIRAIIPAESGGTTTKGRNILL